MLVTASDAKAHLEAKDLYVSARGSASLWIAAAVLRLRAAQLSQ